MLRGANGSRASRDFQTALEFQTPKNLDFQLVVSNFLEMAPVSHCALDLPHYRRLLGVVLRRYWKCAHVQLMCVDDRSLPVGLGTVSC